MEQTAKQLLWLKIKQQHRVSLLFTHVTCVYSMVVPVSVCSVANINIMIHEQSTTNFGILNRPFLKVDWRNQETIDREKQTPNAESVFMQQSKLSGAAKKYRVVKGVTF